MLKSLSWWSEPTREVKDEDVSLGGGRKKNVEERQTTRRARSFPTHVTTRHYYYLFEPTVLVRYSNMGMIMFALLCHPQE